jgi:hypothetical protein
VCTTRNLPSYDFHVCRQASSRVSRGGGTQPRGRRRNSYIFSNPPPTLYRGYPLLRHWNNLSVRLGANNFDSAIRYGNSSFPRYNQHRPKAPAARQLNSFQDINESTCPAPPGEQREKAINKGPTPHQPCLPSKRFQSNSRQSGSAVCDKSAIVFVAIHSTAKHSPA